MTSIKFNFKLKFFDLSLLNHVDFISFQNAYDMDVVQKAQAIASFFYTLCWFTYVLKDLEQKLDRHDSCVEFQGDFDGDGFKAQKPIIDPLIGPN